MHANHWDPFSVLGIHELPEGPGGKKAWIIRAFLPEAASAWVVDLLKGEPGTLVPMKKIHPDGFFARVFRRSQSRPFLTGSRSRTTRDIPGILSILTSSARCSPTSTCTSWPKGRTIAITSGLVPTSQVHRGFRGVHFAVWAPNAQRVSVIGNFNHWDGRRHAMGNRGASGIWELFIPDLCRGRSLQVRSEEPARRLPGREVRSVWLRRRIAARRRRRLSGTSRSSSGTTANGSPRGSSDRVSTSRSPCTKCISGSWKRGDGRQ